MGASPANPSYCARMLVLNAHFLVRKGTSVSMMWSGTSPEDHTLPCYREPHVENTISHRASAPARICNGTVCMKLVEDPEQKAVVCAEKGG
ncbi:hypothetical protein CEXT_57771 [Caerostris extrusa]|uniref:Uncharacterized protein n=1 Tax=Caerostris extrusa TaxID=172846 RepID=A0AAV4XH62_CAEEX|nr:hypothetical protein CEXT_57771 [Caerostris extrusa]